MHPLKFEFVGDWDIPFKEGEIEVSEIPRLQLVMK